MPLRSASRSGFLHAAIVLCAVCTGAAHAQGLAPASPQSAPGAPAAVTSLNGMVADASGAAIGGATVVLRQGSTAARTVRSGADGSFAFDGCSPGTATLTASAEGFSPIQLQVTLPAATMPTLTLRAATTLEVSAVTEQQLAEAQIREEEKQRVLGVLPNFYTVYDKNAAPLTAGQKWQLMGRNLIDPVNLGLVALTVGIQQAINAPGHFEGGAAGYGHRFGVGMADFTVGSVVAGGIFPVVFRQDPRYFYQGDGTVWSRAGHALSSPVRCRGDNRKWQPCWSNVLGQLTASGISNAYYPPEDRSGPGLTFTNLSIGLGSQAVTALLQEFVVRRFTPKAHRNGANQ